MVKYLEIGDRLRATRGDVPIKIKRWGGELLTVYITKCMGNDVWALNCNEKQEVLIYPTRNVVILKIGNEVVQSKERYLEDFEAYKEVERYLKHLEYRELYRGAKRHAFVLGDGEPVK